MNKTYQLSLNLYDIYKEECLPNILSTLTTLDNIKENIFYDLNKGLQSRIDRLINFKSRINRVKQIISSLNNVTQAMMIKSKQYYPNEKINFPKNIYLEEDINGINNLIVSKREDTNANNKKINSKPLYNPKENLLTNTRKFTIDNALIEETLISTMEKYNDISKELYETSLKNLQNIAKEEEGNNLIYEKVRYTNTEFSFFDKKLLQKATLPWEIRNDYETHRLSHVKEEINIRESKNKKKEIQEAPMSIQTGEKLTTYVVSKRNPIFQRSYTTENQLNIPTQHIITKKIDDPKRGNSIQFNVVDQINIKRGGINYYINFNKEGIIKKGEVFLIIGLDSDRKNKKITYSMTSTRSPNLNEFLTQEKIVNDNNQEKNTALRKMFEEAINEINKKSPHSPDYIIIYRQGGNEIRNKILYVSEGDNFTEILKLYREKYKENKNFNFQNTKLYYICCNLKSDLKFFETDNRNVAKAYFNPKSGLIVDDYVTQKNKYEFYLQPQFVNQGTATPCHYQIMYYDKDPNEENNLKIENLEKLSFYLCYYFWTWSGSIRLPYLLKMSNTAMTFYNKILDNGESYYYFKKPTYI